MLDYTSVLRRAGTPAAARMWADAPRSTGDGRVDGAFAAMAEYLARRDGRAVPAWARLPEREAWPAMKLFAARAEIDANDIALLQRQLGFTTERTRASTWSRRLIPAGRSAKVRFFLTEIVDSMQR